MFNFTKNKEEQQQEFKPLFYINPRPQVADIPEIKEKEKIDVKYVLIEPYVYAHISWDKENNELVYNIEEPALDEKEAGILNLLENSINELINISFIGMKSNDIVIEYLEKNLRVLLSELKIKITKESFLKLMYYIYRDFVGLNEVEPLLRDYYIEDIECNGVNTPIYIVHRKYRNIRTNVIFRDIRRLTSFVEKVAQKCGKYISYASPLLDASLPDGSVDYEEPIIYKENGIVKISEIGKFIDKFYNNKESNKPILVENIEVPAFDNKELKINWRKVDYVYRHKNNEDLYEINLEYGRKVKLTRHHSIFVLTKDGVKAEKTENIKENDFVAVPLIIPENDVIKKQSYFDELEKEISYGYKANFFTKETYPNEIASIPVSMFNPLNQCNDNFRNKRMNRDRIKKIMEKIKLKIDNNHPAFLHEWTKKGFFYADKPTNKFYELVKEFDVINKIAESDLGFFKINSIKRVKSTSEFVYDLSVKDHENFISGTGGICCHNSRINATYTQDVSARGPSFTVRKFTTEPWSPVKLMQFKTVSPEMLAYLWLAIEHESNIMVIGGTGSGKCVTGDTPIYLANGQKEDIKNIVEEKFANGKVKTNEGWEYVDCDGTEILSMDQRTLKIIKSKVDKFWRHQAPKNLVKIKTRSGREITTTPEHPFFTINNGEIQKIRADKIKIDERIAVPKKINIENSFKEINLINYLKKRNDIYVANAFDSIKEALEIIKNKEKKTETQIAKEINVKSKTLGCWKNENAIPINKYFVLMARANLNPGEELILKGKTSSLTLKVSKTFQEMYKFAAYVIADGHLTKNNIQFNNSNKKLRDEFSRIGEKIFKLASFEEFPKNRTPKIVFYNNVASAILHEAFQIPYGNKARKVKIPDTLFYQKNEIIAEFIQAIADCESNVEKSQIEICTTSQKLAEGLSYLLLRMNIKFSLITRKTHFRIYISGLDNLKRYQEKINFLHPEKAIDLNKSINREMRKSISNVDLIPNISNLMKNSRIELGLSQKELTNNMNISRRMIGFIETDFRLPSANTFKLFSNYIEQTELNNELKQKINSIANSDILWDEVIDIQELNNHNEKYVYDLSVKDHHNFLAGNIPIVTHNTSLLNSIAFFIPPASRIVTLEDTRELNLLHENWLPNVTRSGVGASNLIGTKEGDISLFDLLKESFRQRPDYVIVGEIRGKEAYVLFQGMSSVRGNEEIFILKDNKPLRIKIKDLEKLDVNRLKAISYDTVNKKVEVLPIKAFVRHPMRNKLYKIRTKFGREITVTPDHSLFTLFNDKIVDITTEDLKIGSKIIIPSTIPCGYNNIEYIDLFEYLPEIRIFAPEYVKEASNKIGYYQASALCNCRSITDYYPNFKRSKPSAIKAGKFLDLMKEANINFDVNKLEFRYDKKSKSFKGNLRITDEFLRLLGYYISEGSLDQDGKIQIYNKDERVLDDMKKCIENITGIKPEERITEGYGSCLELSFSHKVLFEFIKRYCKTKTEKRIPDFIFGLDKRRIGEFLSALYCGDGTIDQNYFGYYTVSKNLTNDVAQLLLVYGIITRIGKRNREGRKTTDYELLFYNSYKKEEFLKYIKPIGKEINLKTFKKTDFRLFGDLYCDEIKSIDILNLDKPEYVYDISVPGNQNFIGGFGSVLLHNSGHPSFGTMHAEDVETLVRRLETPPIELSPSLVESLDIVCIIGSAKVNNKEVRRVKKVVEIVKIREGPEGIETNSPFVWDPRNDNFYFKEESKVFEKIMLHKGISKEKLFREFIFRTKLLVALYKNNIIGFKEVNDLINAYYKTPEAVLKKFNIS